MVILISLEIDSFSLHLLKRKMSRDINQTQTIKAFHQLYLIIQQVYLVKCKINLKIIIKEHETHEIDSFSITLPQLMVSQNLSSEDHQISKCNPAME